MKQYDGEKAIISLTSWKKRINTVSRTIFSLVKQCPGFHIVLVLSEEEFPEKEKELPEDLLSFLNAEVFELLWVKKNYKAFKKWLFTAQKYPNIPIITADDGCIYVKNYAEELYQEWLKYPCDIISEYQQRINKFAWGGGGHGLLFPPNAFGNLGLTCLEYNEILNTNHDDVLYGVLAKKLNINFRFLHSLHVQPKTFIEFDKEHCGLCENRRFKDSAYKIMNQIIKA